MLIRDFGKADTADCLAIYGYYINNTVVTFEEETPTSEEFEARLTGISSRYPFLVATKNNRVLGYAYLDTFNERTAYRHTADLSVYLDKDHCRRGIGSLLYGELERLAKQYGINNIISIVTAQNEASLRFHAKMGFRCVGELQNVGCKFGQWCRLNIIKNPSNKTILILYLVAQNYTVRRSRVRAIRWTC